MSKKKPQPQASKQKQLRRQFGGAFGKAPANLQTFLTSDLPLEANPKRNERISENGKQATEQLRLLIEGD